MPLRTKLKLHVMNNLKSIFFIVMYLCAIGTLQGQSGLKDNSSKFYDMSLEELMNIKVSVASIKPLTTRESPGILTIINEEEIRSLGFRDLMDLLNTIPGFDFGVDVEGIIGLGIRGNWAHEGKFLLLIDGQEMNENLFSSTQFGNHYPLENIKQIEIIRGPGSAIYGGFAEYAVINIITKNGADLQGMTVSATNSFNAHGLSGSRANLSIGKKINDFSVALDGYAGWAQRSDRTYNDFIGNSYSMKRNSGITNYFTNTSLEYKKIQIRFISDLYRINNRDYYTSSLSRAYEEHFDSYFLELKKDIKAGKMISICPKISYKRQLPWNYTGTSFKDEMEVYNVSSEKLSGNLAASLDPSKKVNIQAGIDWAGFRSINYEENSYDKNGKSTTTYFNQAAYLQTLFRMRLADFTLGARYNFSNRYGTSIIPRIGITRVIHKVHFKCLYSNAFRLPSTENINSGKNIKPEKTWVFELETGITINSNMFLSLNAYNIRTYNTIVYYYDEFNDADAYKNYYGSGTQGIEVVYKVKHAYGWAELNYALYNSRQSFRQDNYEVPDNENVLLGLPAHKLNAKGTIKFNSRLSIGTSLTWISKRYGCIGKNNQGISIIRTYPSVFTANLNVMADHFLTKGLQVSLGVNNITNSSIQYIQPYNSYHPPLPGQSREYSIKLIYNLPL